MLWLTMHTRTTVYRALVVVATILAPVLGGAVIYYSLRKTHPRTARFANLMSVAGFIAWNTVVPWDWARHDGRVLVGILGSIGLIATELSIRLIRNTEDGSEPVTTTVASPPNEELKPTATPSSLVE